MTLRWSADSEHPRPEVVGSYISYAQAVSAMEDSLLVDGFVTDTNREEWLDDVCVAADPASMACKCADYGRRVTLIDPRDHHHFGPAERVSGPSPAGGVSARTAVLQEGALNAAPPLASRPGGGSDSIGDGRAITP